MEHTLSATPLKILIMPVKKNWMQLNLLYSPEDWHLLNFPVYGFSSNITQRAPSEKVGMEMQFCAADSEHLSRNELLVWNSSKGQNKHLIGEVDHVTHLVIL